MKWRLSTEKDELGASSGHATRPVEVTTVICAYVRRRLAAKCADMCAIRALSTGRVVQILAPVSWSRSAILGTWIGKARMQ